MGYVCITFGWLILWFHQPLRQYKMLTCWQYTGSLVQYCIASKRAFLRHDCLGCRPNLLYHESGTSKMRKSHAAGFMIMSIYRVPWLDTYQDFWEPVQVPIFPPRIVHQCTKYSIGTKICQEVFWETKNDNECSTYIANLSLDVT